MSQHTSRTRHCYLYGTHRYEHHRSVFVKLDIVFRGIICRIEVVRMSGKLGRKSIDPLDEGSDA